jgi:hypothetical protein
MLIGDSEVVLASMLDGAGVNRRTMSPVDVRKTVEVFRLFAALPVDEVAPPEEDGDGLLAQFGTYERMRDLTRTLIDAAAKVMGTFYLPYRLHATSDQMRRAYPGWEATMVAKSRVDPQLVFRNALYDAYAN